MSLSRCRPAIARGSRQRRPVQGHLRHGLAYAKHFTPCQDASLWIASSCQKMRWCVPPMAVAQGERSGERALLLPPTRALATPQIVPFLWGTSRQVVGPSGGGLSYADLTNPSLTRHSSGTGLDMDTLPPPPDTRPSCRGLFVEARSFARPIPSGDGAGRFGSADDCRSFRGGAD